MNLLYSNIPPLTFSTSTSDFISSFSHELSQSDALDIAVGYVSQASLEELRSLVKKFKIKICLIIGMYFIEGMPEKTYRLAKHINEDWMKTGCGEIRLVKIFKYHGKIYCFSKQGKIISVILGSANLSAIKLDSTNRRQYEVSVRIEDKATCRESYDFIQKLKDDKLSFNISAAQNIPLIHERNTNLDNMEHVHQVPATDLGIYEIHTVGSRFLLPLKAPLCSERFMDDGRHYTQSNLNTCYAAPRSARKPRDWYEIQFTVPSSVYKQPGYPKKGVPFIVITDDGYSFKVHTTSSSNKQFNAVGNELLLGRWLKGRLAASGLVSEVADTSADKRRTGMITQEMLDEYGCHNLYLQKTNKKAEDDEGNTLDVWLLGFAYDKTLKQEDGGSDEE